VITIKVDSSSRTTVTESSTDIVPNTPSRPGRLRPHRALLSVVEHQDCSHDGQASYGRTAGEADERQHPQVKG